jgi:hypothetical protein
MLIASRIPQWLGLSVMVVFILFHVAPMLLGLVLVAVSRRLESEGTRRVLRWLGILLFAIGAYFTLRLPFAV